MSKIKLTEYEAKMVKDFENDYYSYGNVPISKIAEALCHGYEVEPEYKGDLPHATPEEIEQEQERRWLSKIDRKPGEIKPYDIVTHEFVTGLWEVVSVEGDGTEAEITDDFSNNVKRVVVRNLMLDTPREYRRDGESHD